MEKDGKYGFIDKTGKEIIPFVYDSGGTFNDGVAVVKKFGKDGYGKYIYIDKTGKEILSADNLVDDINEGLAALYENEKWGYADKTGKIIVPLIYDFVLGFNDGIAAVQKDGKWSILEIIKPAAAIPTASIVLVNGINKSFDAYNINGSNYFKLRDLAYVLNDTEKRFEVGWKSEDNAISLTSGKFYTPVGGEMSAKSAGNKTATPTKSKIYLDGKEINLTAYNIDGNNYFKLRDIGQAFDFGVTWDGAKNTIGIDTNTGYMPE